MKSISKGFIRDMKTHKRILLYLIFLAIFDLVIPFPITAVILIYILCEKPEWFKKIVSEVYNKPISE